MWGRFLPADQEIGDDPDWDPAEEGPTRSNERQRIARELHDSTSQLLVVLQLQLSQLNRLAAPGAESLIEECWQIIEELHEQIRAMNSG